ncbi:hypothetical protein KKH00_03665 [Patescibacteria group bacterium]|nr:hypothetical protein [Patescibacteria group bacterium]
MENKKTHAIITFTKSHHLITAEQELMLRGLDLGREIEVDGNRIKANNIAEILTIEKYYETYPDKRVAEVPLFKSLPEPILSEDQIKIKQVKRLRLMIRGINKYIAGNFYQGTDKSKKILEFMQSKLEKAKQGINFEIKDFYKVMS